VFHERRVLQLMRRAHRLDEIVPNAPLKGTVLVTGELHLKEIKKRIKLALGSVPSDAVLEPTRHLRPDDDFIEMVSVPYSSSPPCFP
jgi:hypothetical protein